MAHCVVLVVGDVEDTFRQVEELMRPYDASLPIEPYETCCFCIGIEAEEEDFELAREAFRRRHPVDYVSNLVEGFDPDEDLPEEVQRKVDAYEAEWRAALDYYKELHPLYQKPSPDCENCDGSGVESGMHNPIAEWTEWEIGERFDGQSCIPVDELIARYDLHQRGQLEFRSFQAVVTPDGIWHEHWVVRRLDGEPEEIWEERYDVMRRYWDLELLAILHANRTCTAVSVEYPG